MLTWSIISLLVGSNASAQSIAAGADLRTGSAGAIDGLRVEGRLPVAGSVSLAVRSAFRVSGLQHGDAEVDEWQRRSELGLLDDRGRMPVGADVWSTDLLMGVQLPLQALPVHLQAGWQVRGQSTALLTQSAGEFVVTTDARLGVIETRWVNPTVGVAAGLPVGGPFAVEATVQQVFPVQDPVLTANPGFTVVGLAMRLGRKQGVVRGGGDTDGGDGTDGIRVLGVAELDAVFKEVQGILDELEALREALDTALAEMGALSTRLNAGSVSDLLQGLVSGDLNVGVTLSLKGGKPVVTPTAALEGEAAVVAQSLQSLSDAVQAVQAVQAALAERAKALVQKAQKVAAGAPKMLQQSGVSPMKLPTVLRDVKHNVQVTIGVPEALAETLAAATDAVELLAVAAGGAG